MFKRCVGGFALIALLGVAVPRTARARLDTAAPSASADPRLAEILLRAGRYVVDYEVVFRNLVAEEASTQWADPLGTSREGLDPARRQVRSDIVFLVLPGPLRWGCFRDVFEVDGQRVRDREARLEKLLLGEGDASSVERAKAILAEGSRYNIGARRTANIPTLPLIFLHPSNQGRFRFELKGHRRFHDREGVEVRFVETARPAFVTDFASGDLPSSGSFWIVPETGAVLRSDVTYEFPPRRATAWNGVEYRPEPGWSILVPAEMRERYKNLPEAVYLEFGPPTEATNRYSHYRRFTVSTDETIVSPSP